MIQILCNDKTDEIHKKIVEVQRNLGDNNSNSNFKYLKFVSFPSIIDQDILINLQLQWR